jgi:molybdopterin-binding protein
MVCADVDGGMQLEVPLSEVDGGSRITVGLRASDIILAATEPQGSSARNRLPGVVSGIELRPPGYQVTLSCGTGDLKCHITGTSLNEMGIAVGNHLWAVFKASSCFLVSDDD